MAFAGSAAAAGREREGALDGARLLAMLAMVFGHTADALLADGVRALPSVKLYWVFRGFTAPLFLVVSGWAFWTAANVHRTGGRALLDRFGRRAFLLLGAGYLLRLPLWDLGGFLRGDAALWHHFTGFDALHAVAASLLCASLLFAATADRTARALALASLTLGIPLVSTALSRWSGWQLVPTGVRALFLTDAESTFPLLPWCAYFFGGALIAAVAELSPSRRVRGATLLALGLALVGVAAGVGIRSFTPTHPVLFLQRFGFAVAVVAAVSLLPRALLARALPWSRSSLGVYVFHILALFGYWRWTGLIVVVGRRLELWEVSFLALLLFAGGLVVVSSLEQLSAAWSGVRARPKDPVLLRAPGIHLTARQLITHGRRIALRDVHGVRVQQAGPLLGARPSLLLGAVGFAWVLSWIDVFDEPFERAAVLGATALLCLGAFRFLSTERRSTLWLDREDAPVAALRTHDAALVDELAERVRQLLPR